MPVPTLYGTDLKSEKAVQKKPGIEKRICETDEF